MFPIKLPAARSLLHVPRSLVDRQGKLTDPFDPPSFPLDPSAYYIGLIIIGVLGQSPCTTLLCTSYALTDFITSVGHAVSLPHDGMFSPAQTGLSRERSSVPPAPVADPRSALPSVRHDSSTTSRSLPGFVRWPTTSRT